MIGRHSKARAKHKRAIMPTRTNGGNAARPPTVPYHEVADH